MKVKSKKAKPEKPRKGISANTSSKETKEKEIHDAKALEARSNSTEREGAAKVGERAAEQGERAAREGERAAKNRRRKGKGEGQQREGSSESEFVCLGPDLVPQEENCATASQYSDKRISRTPPSISQQRNHVHGQP